MLSVDYQFDRDDIWAVSCLSITPAVYLLLGYFDDKLLLKHEGLGGAQQSALKHNLKFMAAVDPLAKNKLLSLSEVTELQQWTAGPRVKGHSADEANLAAEFIYAGREWVKMAYHSKLLDLERAAENRLKGDKKDVRGLANALNAPGGLEKLGEIAAADLFNGNTDRFSLTQPMTWNNIRLKAMSNIGNLFVTFDASGERVIIGLDPWDKLAANNFGDVNLPLAKAESDGGAWPGRLLAADKKGELRTFATDVIDDMETCLGRRNRKIPLARTKRLDSNAVDRMLKGVQQGVVKIQDKLRARAAANKEFPPGLKDRCATLNWVF